MSQVHDSILSSYLQDVLKYERNLSADSVELILSSIMGQVGSQIKYSRLAEGLSSYKVRQALHVLEKALVVHPILSSSAQGVPLAGSVNSKVLKAVFMDMAQADVCAVYTCFFKHPETSEGIVLHAGTGGRHDHIHFCPLYAKF